jgi:hypothetical protein
MPAPDDFSSYIGELLRGSYDCVDRIVLRAYFPMGQTSGGFLTWWNRLYPNTELNQEQLRRMAGDFSRRVRAYSTLKFFAIFAFFCGYSSLVSTASHDNSLLTLVRAHELCFSQDVTFHRAQ